MTDHKFTDDDVIKALELHSNKDVACLDKCPYAERHFCGSLMARDALALINRQKKEIENLQSEVEILQQRVESAPYTLEQITESIKIEAIKEFAERLITELTTGAGTMRISVLAIIDTLVKEMTETK